MRNLFRRSRGGTAEEVPETEELAGPGRRHLTPEELDALLPRAQFDRASAEYRGHFEGLWTDRRDAPEIIERRQRAGQLSEVDAELLRFWLEHGYVIIPGAVSMEVCDQLQADLSHAFANGDERLRVLKPGEHFGQPLQPGTDMRGMRVNDVYVHLESARQALFADDIVHFLRLVFDGSPMLLQSLTFESGSRQGVHQDTAYVVIDPPLALAASWIALEDIKEGSGELVYYEGSHRLSDFLFDDAYKCWHPERDGSEAHDRYLASLVDRSEAQGLPLKRLLAKRGDVLIWSGDLAHGGGPVTDESLTRRSLVGHYCPEWAVPRYFDQFPEHSVRAPYQGGFYATTHYVLGSEN
jgi:phytanoyl-CoA hydroxylase